MSYNQEIKKIDEQAAFNSDEGTDTIPSSGLKLFNFIYQVTCLPTGLIYVGKRSTNKLEDGYLGTGTLQKEAIKLYGKNNFEREILQYCFSLEEMCEKEKFWICELNSNDRNIGYNINVVSSNGMSGKIRSQETRDKHSISMTGVRKTPEHIEHSRLARIGLKRTPEQNKINSIAQTGKKLSPESIEKTRIGNTGQKRTEEQCVVIRLMALNRPKIFCPHCKQWIGVNTVYKFHLDNCKSNPNRKEHEDLRPIIECPHCHFEGKVKSAMLKHHFDNCKLKAIYE